MIFIETSLQNHLLLQPDSGDLVKGSGGVRKVRWAPEGQGKSGGVRVIYYWKKSDNEMWMLTIYSKSERATISGHQLKKIAEAIENDKS
ncbi:MAG: type II toxin-antitoxin system RelE/ParE family toxin [Aestuariibacter sp.]